MYGEDFFEKNLYMPPSLKRILSTYVYVYVSVPEYYCIIHMYHSPKISKLELKLISIKSHLRLLTLFLLLFFLLFWSAFSGPLF